jgi:AraC-like DNA-binding protein
MWTGLLSQIINKGLHRRFNGYINDFRLRAIKQALQEGAHQRMSLLGIALDCGFNSKATFNRVFRKQFGQTPSEYPRQLDQPTSPTSKSVD